MPAVVAAVSAGLLSAGAPLAAAAVAPPPTVPSVRDWTSGGDGFALGARPRVWYARDELRAAAADLAASLATATGRQVIAESGAAAAPGDIVLSTGSVAGAPDTPEAYRITVGDKLELRGADVPGAFYATRSALQMLRQRTELPGGTATDWPQYRERSLMLDVGREFMPVEMIRQQIRRMGYLKMNLLHLHLSDTYGFRLESSRHPEITAPQHYSKQDIRDLIDYAADNQVEILPEVDFPGHLNGVLAAHPELKLRSRTGAISDAAMDISDPRGRDLMRDILEEFLPLFPGRYWHLGGDEFLLQGAQVASYDDYPQLGAYARAAYGPRAQPADALLGLIEWGAGIVRAHGKRPRIWNDGLRTGEGTIGIDPDIVVDYWSRAGVPELPLPFFGTARTPTDLIAAGHEIRNAAFTPTYYVAGGPASIANVPPEVAYEFWDPALFVDGTRLTSEQDARNRGSGLFVWADDPTVQTPDQISVAITWRLRVIAQQTWNPVATGQDLAHPRSYREFAARADAVGEPVP